MLVAVDEVADRLAVPFDGVDVVIARDRRVTVREGCVAGVSGPMHGGARNRRFAALVLHDVHLTAPGPTDGADVVAAQPERRPQPLPCREFDARLNAPG